MVELVDTPDLGSGDESRGSSTLPIPTKFGLLADGVLAVVWKTTDVGSSPTRPTNFKECIMMNTALLLGITVILILAAVLGFILYSAYQASKAWSEFGKQMSAMLEAKRKNDAR